MLEKILQSSIKSRHVVVLLAVLAAALGAAALRRLPIDAVPDITNNQVMINTLFPALAPVEMEKQITAPIEIALAGIPGLAHTRSFSRNGFSQITAVFDDDVDVYFARNQVNERLAGVRPSLPDGANPFLGPITTGLGEIYMYVVEYEHPRGAGATVHDGKPGWQSDGSYLTPEGDRLRSELELATYLRTVQDWVIRPQLRNVKGVASVDSNGGYVKQYHVQPDPMKLVSYGLAFSDVIEALERNNVATGAGFVERLGEAYTVRADARLASAAEIESVPVGSREGFPILVRDVARVVLGREARMGSASENGREIVLGTALMLVKSNSRVVAAAVGEKLEEVRRSLPPDVNARTVLDRKHLVDATIRTVAVNLFEGAVLVIVVLFLMLGNIRAALICALAIPLSMLMAVAGMVQTKTSGNLMSLGAIDFGLIIDGAIIIVENCLRRLAERQHAAGRLLTLEERLEEVGVAAREMIGPSVFGQAIIVTVYLPILALTGIEGKMFEPMAVTVILALASAFVLSLTLVPALVALLVRGRVREGDNALVAFVKRLYGPTLAVAMRARVLVVVAAVLAFGGAAWLFTRLGSEFTPNLDEHDVVVMATRPLSTGIEQSTRMQFDLERALDTLQEVRVVFSRTGTAEMATDPMMPCLSDTFIVLKPRKEWPDPRLDKAELIRRIEHVVEGVPGNAYEFTQPIQMRFNELIAGVRSDVAVKVYGDDLERMEASAQAVAAVLGRIRGAADVKVEQTEGLPLMNVVPDREVAGRLGVDMVEVQDLVSTAIGGHEAGVVFEGDRRVEVIVRLDEAARSERDALCDLPLRIDAHAGEARGDDHVFGEHVGASYVPLCTVADIVLSTGPHQISRHNGKRMITVQANVRGRDLGTFVEEAQQRVRAVELPPGGWLEWGGQFENLTAAKERLAFVVPLCFFLIFLLLFSAFRSVSLALLVFSGVPLGLTGGIVALWLRGIPFSITAAVGFIALSGVAVLNGLVMVSAIERSRREGAALDDAIRVGSLTRLRPVLMTALVASLGFLPMAIATGTGAEVQRPLATVVIGGLVSSTLLTLVVLPALYRMFARVPRTG